MSDLHYWFRFELGRNLRCGMTLREARVTALAAVREPLPF